MSIFLISRRPRTLAFHSLLKSGFALHELPIRHCPHHPSQSSGFIHEGDAGKTPAILEAVAHDQLLWPEAALSHRVGLEIIKILYLSCHQSLSIVRLISQAHQSRSSSFLATKLVLRIIHHRDVHPIWWFLGVFWSTSTQTVLAVQPRCTSRVCHQSWLYNKLLFSNIWLQKIVTHLSREGEERHAVLEHVARTCPSSSRPWQACSLSCWRPHCTWPSCRPACSLLCRGQSCCIRRSRQWSLLIKLKKRTKQTKRLKKQILTRALT